MPQSGSTAVSRHQVKETRGTTKNNTNAKYDTTDARRKTNCKRTTLEMSVEKLPWGLNQMYSRKTSPLILMQLQKQIYIYSVHTGVLTSFVKHHSETHILTNTVKNQSKGLNCDLKSEDKKTTNRATMSPTTIIEIQKPII